MLPRAGLPVTIACGQCFFCKRELWSLCDNSNPNAWMAEKVNGYSGAELFGYSHMYGGYAGGQAEYIRVPFADVGPIKIPAGLRDERVLFLSDIFPIGYMAAENCAIQRGATVVVWGCGPVGQFAMRSAYTLGADHVIAIDRIPERLQMAHMQHQATVLDYQEVDVSEALQNLTEGADPMPTLMRWRWKRVAPASMPSMTGQRWPCSWPLTASMHRGKPSRHAVKVAPCPFQMSMAACWIRCR